MDMYEKKHCLILSYNGLAFLQNVLAECEYEPWEAQLRTGIMKDIAEMLYPVCQSLPAHVDSMRISTRRQLLFAFRKAYPAFNTTTSCDGLCDCYMWFAHQVITQGNSEIHPPDVMNLFSEQTLDNLRKLAGNVIHPRS